MPIEDRRIIFDSLETYKALYTLSAKQEDVPPLIAGAIKGIKVSSQDDNFFEITIENQQTEKRVTIVYSRDFVAAALMMLCRGHSIPLPKKAKKDVLIEDGQFVLRVMIDKG